MVKESVSLDPFRLRCDRSSAAQIAEGRSVQVEDVEGNVEPHGQAGAQEYSPPDSRPSPGCSVSAHNSPPGATEWRHDTHSTRRTWFCQSEGHHPVLRQTMGPRRSDITPRSACRTSSCLRSGPRGSALGFHLSRCRMWVHSHYGPANRSPSPWDGFVDWPPPVRFLPRCNPSYRSPDCFPGGTVPHQACQPFTGYAGPQQFDPASACSTDLLQQAPEDRIFPLVPGRRVGGLVGYAAIRPSDDLVGTVFALSWNSQAGVRSGLQSQALGGLFGQEL